MTKYLLSQPNSDGLFLLSERVSQDPLENYFGKQRARGGRCDNPTVKECIKNAVAIRAQRSLDLDRVQGNCRRKRRLERTVHKLLMTLHLLSVKGPPDFFFLCIIS